ncbi:THAP domain-containing protein 3-like [Xenia sp. Carnegie-2017]|uniref:THAP domain-containing protein 3-like n=1 Tax=Xenia sp. Carnegie-2017 TaxID=2897299 RepID=UPI001F04A01C|nr:THAP domain-containing protein 3-like [Xenia sp. Carnegie-2017]
MASRQNSVKNRRGWPNGKSCTNSQHTEGVSVHRFPMNDKERLSKWTKFVRRHRPKFVPQQYSVLCSMHFADSAFTVNATVAKSLNMRRQLRSDAVPTIDSVKGISIQGDKSNRDRRVVLREVTRSVKDVEPAVKHTDDEGNSDECNTTESVDSEPVREDSPEPLPKQEQVEMCSRCDILAKKVTKLQNCRHVLAVLHFNENLHRQPKKKIWNTILFCYKPKI